MSSIPVAHAPGPDTTETPVFLRRAVQESNLWPWASETHGQAREVPGNKVFPRVVCPACATRVDPEALRAPALALLEAVDQGAPAVDLARTLAVEALRRLPPDSPGWCRAVEVLEGGPLRMRRAVDLAGLALDATDAADAELRRRLSARATGDARGQPRCACQVGRASRVHAGAVSRLDGHGRTA